jgi:hypothetical protein
MRFPLNASLLNFILSLFLNKKKREKTPLFWLMEAIFYLLAPRQSIIYSISCDYPMICNYS